MPTSTAQISIAGLHKHISDLHTRVTGEQRRLERLKQAIEAALSMTGIDAIAETAVSARARTAQSGLDEVQALVDATADLRVPSGNLSASAVAGAFGISLSQLAGWLGRTRQAVSKTPDADSLQDGLAAFERVARLRAALSQDAFLKWLRMPNAQLDGTKPLDLLAADDRAAIVGLVEDMLTGMPT